MLNIVTGRLGRAALFALLGLFLASLAAAPQASAEELKQSGTIYIKQVQIAWIGSGNLGGGTLQYNGRSWPFTIGGLGIGGFGISQITATGEVYNLKDIAYFPGAYGQ